MPARNTCAAELKLSKKAMRTHYDVLGIEFDATNETISSAFRMLAKRWHPDLNAGNDRSAEQFKQVTAAYVTLRNSASRAAYDETLVAANSHRNERRTRKFIYCVMVIVATVIASLVSGGIWRFRSPQEAAEAAASITSEQGWRLHPPALDAPSPHGLESERASINASTAEAVVPKLAVAPVIDVEASASSRLLIGVTGRVEDLPLGTRLRVRGLPTGVTLSDGQPNVERGWIVPLWALEELNIKVPPRLSGNLDLEVALADNDGVLLDERSVLLRVTQAAATAPTAHDAADAAPAMETAAHVKRIMPAVPSAIESVPTRRKGAVTMSALHPEDAATASRGQHRNRRTAPGSNVDVSGPSQQRRWEREGAREVPYQNGCLVDNRAPCNIGGGNGWWLGQAMGDLTRRGGSE